MIGEIGFDCRSFSWRQIIEIWLANITQKWDLVSALLAQIQNVNSETKAKPADFNPLRSNQTKTIKLEADELGPGVSAGGVLGRLFSQR